MQMKYIEISGLPNFEITTDSGQKFVLLPFEHHDIPTADVIEVKHAHWTGILPSDYSHAEGMPPNATTEQKEAYQDYMEHITHCSNCGVGFDDRMVKNWKCCPCCIAMMEVKV